MSSGAFADAVQPYRPLARACGAITLLAGAGVLGGWLFDLAAVKSVLPGHVSMKPNTALAFALAGASLLLQLRDRDSPARARAARVLALAVVAVALATLFEFLTNSRLGIDELLFRDDPNSPATLIAGRMAPSTAVAFLLLGSALALADVEPWRRPLPAELLAVFPAALGVISMVEYTFGHEVLYSFHSYTRMALHTAALFVILPIGVIFARPTRGVVGSLRTALATPAERRVYGTLAAGFLVLLVVGLAAFLSAAGSLERAAAVREAEGLRRELAALVSSLHEMEAAQRGYIITAAPAFLASYTAAQEGVSREFGHLRAHPLRDSALLGQLAELQARTNAWLAYTDDLVRLRGTQGLQAAARRVESAEGKRLMDSIHSLAKAMDEAQQVSVLARAEEASRQSVRRTRVTLSASAGLAVSLVLFSVFVIRRDFGLRKRAEDDLHRANADLAAANKELEAFSYSVSHDLRAPLRAIDGFSQALVDDFSAQLDERAVGYLQRVRANAQHMAQLIDDLLKLSRITRADLNPVVVDFSQIAREVLDSLREANPLRVVEVFIDDGLHARADPRLAFVLMENLLGNAWKFTGRTERARIEVGRNSEGRDSEVFMVRDNGAGFEMAYASKLFGAFQRLHSTADFEGTGIGLATAQRIVHRHGGRIWAEAAPGKGATFYFTLSDQSHAPAGTPLPARPVANGA